MLEDLYTEGRLACSYTMSHVSNLLVTDVDVQGSDLYGKRGENTGAKNNLTAGHQAGVSLSRKSLADTPKSLFESAFLTA